MSTKTARTLLLASPLLVSLGACDGYELVRTDAFPYGNQRTAGTGVAYVLAKMMPEKDLNLQPVEPRPAPAPLEETKEIMSDIPEPPEEPVKDGDEVFREQQKK